MENINKITSDFETESISVQEVQRRLSRYLYLEANEMDCAVSSNKIEAAIRTIENDLELILYTMKEENQVEATLAILSKATRLLAGRFDLDKNN